MQAGFGCSVLEVHAENLFLYPAPLEIVAVILELADHLAQRFFRRIGVVRRLLVCWYGQRIPSLLTAMARRVSEGGV